MSNDRKCSICGGLGHDARNCPMRDADTPRDKIVWYKISNLTDTQADKMTSELAKAKRKIAPDAQAAFIKADRKSLPERITKALGCGEDND